MQEFAEAVTFIQKVVKDHSVKLRSEQQLALYAAYKQATCGDCSTARPGMLEFRERAKWDVWNQVKGQSKTSMHHAYVKTVDSICPEWRSRQQKPVDVTPDTGDKTTGDTTTANEYWKHSSDEEEASAGGSGFAPAVSTMSANCIDDNVWKDDEQLFKAASTGDVDLVQVLLDSGATIDAQDAEGRTALHFACDRGHTEAVRVLVSRGARTDIVDTEGDSPFDYAITCEHLDAAKILKQ